MAREVALFLLWTCLLVYTSQLPVEQMNMKYKYICMVLFSIIAIAQSMADGIRKVVAGSVNVITLKKSTPGT